MPEPTQPGTEGGKAAQESGKPVPAKTGQDKPEQLKAEAVKAAGEENITLASIKQPAAVSVKPDKNPPQPSAQDASAMIEKWRKSWEKGDLDSYLTLYSPKAVQAGRDFERMRAQKRKIWKNARPAKVAFHDIRITLTARGFSVTMLQSYTDSKGYSDRGMKTLQLEADGKTMRIVREDWTPEI